METRFCKISLLLVLFLISLSCFSQDKIATLPNGKKVILYDDFSWTYYEGVNYGFDFSTIRENEIPSFLRQGIYASRATIITATEMYLQGWRYTMPVPKSSQARWGNGDGRTTWWHGYWYNKETGKYSETTPLKKQSGYYVGDAQNRKGNWRNGGSPRTPTKIDWMLSDYGGVKP